MFVHLHCHSHYSFLRATPSPESLIAAAQRFGMTAVALTDANGMHAAVSFYQKAQTARIKPIVGVTLDVAWSGEKNRTTSTHVVPVVLLAQNFNGYSNLCRLLTLRNLGTLSTGSDKTPSKERARPVTFEEIAQQNDGLIALSPCFVRQKSPQPASSLGTEYFSRLKDIFDNRLYIEVQKLSPGDGRWLREAEQLHRSFCLPLVATNNVHFLQPEEHLHHRTVNAIRTGELLTTIEPPEITSPEAWFKPEKEMQRLFSDHPKLLQMTEEITERCNLKLELGKMLIPEFPVPENETSFSYLETLCQHGLQRLYTSQQDKAEERLAYELRIIQKWNLASYFLLVHEIVNEAKARGIPAVARGSAASSIVLYSLGISRICPLRWELYFERFLNEERGGCPDVDIDIDICGARRDELLDYVYERWGEDHVAMIGSFVTMHARLAIREVAKAFGVPSDEVNYFTRRVPHSPIKEALEAIRKRPECRDLPVNEEPWKTILQVAACLDAAPRHLGIHPCGTVISAKPLTSLAPLERAAKGIVITQYDMDTIEALGLIKMDLLGQRGFTTMSLALDNIETSQQQGTDTHKNIAPDGVTPLPNARNIHFDDIPENDPATCDMIAAGKTLGIFQIESPAMRSMLRMQKARTLEEVAIALSIIRPGAAEYGSKELYVKRLNGQETIEYAHPSLEKILQCTLGVCVYQEQAMQIGRVFGNLSYAEADEARRHSYSYSGRQNREHLRIKFEQTTGMMGLTAEQQKNAWMMVEKFGAFGFCKAHAGTYADISYRMAYLKAHHPGEFLAAMCSAGAGFYHTSAYVEEAKRWGIEVRLPSVNQSHMGYTTESTDRKNALVATRRAIRIGLMQIRGLQLETILQILRAREANGLFGSLEDFLRRVSLEPEEIENLIKCGAFDGLQAATRPELLWRYSLFQTRKYNSNSAHNSGNASGHLIAAANGSACSFFGNAPDMEEDPLSDFQTTEYSLQEKLRYEREILEVCVSGHPLDFLPRRGEIWSDEIPSQPGNRVTLCGWVITYRHVITKTYQDMMFVTLEDQRGVYEVVLFPNAYERYGRLVFETRALRVTGRTERDGQLNCEILEALAN